jgi:hypothetical protein
MLSSRFFKSLNASCSLGNMLILLKKFAGCERVTGDTRRSMLNLSGRTLDNR